MKEAYTEKTNMQVSILNMIYLSTGFGDGVKGGKGEASKSTGVAASGRIIGGLGLHFLVDNRRPAHMHLTKMINLHVGDR